MNGAETLVQTLLAADVNVCFANPGTSEMHFVSALDRAPEMRSILGLFEGVVTGAADGYYRIAERPAVTLLHLGPGLANGLANLHNARKARSGIVNVVGEHATEHLELDAPLTADIEGIARPLSDWVRTAESPTDVAVVAAAAIRAARGTPGQIATLILPANTAWGEAGQPVRAEPPGQPTPVTETAVRNAAVALRSGERKALILGGRSLRGRALEAAGRIAAKTGCALLCENLNARLERGAGRVQLQRIPYAVDAALALLQPYIQFVLVGANAPVAFFAYPDKPGRLTPEHAVITCLADAGADVEAALLGLADEIDAIQAGPKTAALATASLPTGRPTSEGLGRVLGALIPDNAIVIDEAITTGQSFAAQTAGARPHDWLNSPGGSIGFGLPLAIGAAIAAPDRKVIALEGDGSAMYTLQALWTIAREQLDITVVVFANNSYAILKGELGRLGTGNPGPRALDMLSLDRPCLDWPSLVRGHGVAWGQASNLEEFADELGRGLATPGPYVVVVAM